MRPLQTTLGSKDGLYIEVFGFRMNKNYIINPELAYVNINVSLGVVWCAGTQTDDNVHDINLFDVSGKQNNRVLS